MPTKTAKSKTPKDILKLTAIDALPELAQKAEALKAGQFQFRYTTGPFLLPQNAGSLDWIVINNDTTTQNVRVTVFSCPIASPKTALPPGPLVLAINAGVATHNANKYTPGFVYEIQVECNSQLVLPYVSVWPGNMGYAIPGTGINSGTFVRMMP